VGATSVGGVVAVGAWAAGAAGSGGGGPWPDESVVDRNSANSAATARQQIITIPEPLVGSSNGFDFGVSMIKPPSFLGRSNDARLVSNCYQVGVLF
jgi:hypothetical protein